MPTARPLVFGMVTTSRSHAYTHVALKSFFQWTTLEPADQFFLIDNNADFESALPSSFTPGLQLIRNSKPLGFSANANQTIAIALEHKADLLFLNNDLVFAKNWLPPLLGLERSIVSPLCNRDVQYAISTVVPKTSHVTHTFALRMVMELSDYVGNEANFAAIAESHQRAAQGYFPTLNVPFFGIRIPYTVLEQVGRFDEAYGNGGGEDYDYGLRAYLAGFDIQIALASFILHFQGRSSWAGGETSEEQMRREEQFFQRFIEKWGMDLFLLILRERTEVLAKASPIRENQRAESLRQVIKDLKGQHSPPIKI